MGESPERAGELEFLVLTPTGKVLVRNDAGHLVPITLPFDRVEALRAAAAGGVSTAAVAAVLCAELADREGR